MRQRATSEESKPVGLFPFLAVLLCTMGALLVLLVVLAQRAGERVLSQQPGRPSADQSVAIVPPEKKMSPAHDAEAETLAEQLREVQAYQAKLRLLRKQAEERLRQEQLQLSHIEEHTRRIEQELAHLAIAAKQLEATENNQEVDEQEAESELKHLKELINETEEQLAQLREEASGEHSYAIVPYKGPHGTYRRPIYIECSKEGVIIRPEGIKFNSSDFVAPRWPGNPLAAALRASREYLNAKAARAGEPEPPDPYPLLIVRPDGITQYQLARLALASWDADFGYEFVDSDWKLEYPDLPDPQMAQLQHHAQFNAREQLARLIRSAPSRYHGIGLGSGSSMASGGSSGSRGYGPGGQAGGGNDSGSFAQTDDGVASAGGDSAGGLSLADSGTTAGDLRYGSLGGEGDNGNNANGDSNQGSSNQDNSNQDNSNQDNGSQVNGDQDNSSQNDGTDSFAAAAGAESSVSGGGSGEKESASQQPGQGGSQSSEANAQSSGFAQSGGQSASGKSAAGSGSANVGSLGGPPSSASPSGPTAATASLNLSNQNVKNIAKSRGKNWAISQGARGGVPIRRPIHVVVRRDRLTLMPTRHANGGVESTGTIISLNQSTKQVSDQFVAALRTRVEQWGIAGNGLYWRPVLKLNIGPEAEETARGLAKLLQHSGIELSRQKSVTRR